MCSLILSEKYVGTGRIDDLKATPNESYVEEKSDWER